MRDRLILLVGLCGLAGFCFWSARQIFQHRVARPVAATQTASKPVVPAPKLPSPPTPPSVPCYAPKAQEAGDITNIAFRVDRTQVFFPVSDNNAVCLGRDQIEKLVKLGTPVAENGPGGIWIANDTVTGANDLLFNRAQRGEVWQLEVSAGSRVPVIIKEPVVAAVVGDMVAGFLAEVAPSGQAEFTVSPNQYFAIHKTIRGHRQPGAALPHVGELPDWRSTPELTAKIEQALQSQMKEEVMRRYQQSTSASEQAVDRRVDQLRDGKGKLDYDMRAFQMTPDGVPRVFVRARWRIDLKPAFFMTAWLRLQPEPAIENADTSMTTLMLEFEGAVETVEQLGIILNVFNYDGDGYGEFLFFQRGWEGFGIELFRYTDAGPVSTKVTFGGSA